jgi:hypothetical protein
MKPKWKTPAEIAYDWGLSTRQVLRLIQRGKLPAMRVNSRVILISEVDAAVHWANLQLSGTTGTTKDSL